MKYLNELKNMKKTYMSPEMDVIELKNQQQLLAGSDFGKGTMPGGSAAAPDFYFDDED